MEIDPALSGAIIALGGMLAGIGFSMRFLNEDRTPRKLHKRRGLKLILVGVAVVLLSIFFL